MSREKRYVFRMMLTRKQQKILKNTIALFRPTLNDDPVLAFLYLDDAAISAVILPKPELAVLMRAMRGSRRRTDGVQLGVIG